MSTSIDESGLADTAELSGEQRAVLHQLFTGAATAYTWSAGEVSDEVLTAAVRAAGHGPTAFKGSTGVYAGSGPNSSTRPRYWPNTPPRPRSSPTAQTSGSRRISSASAVRPASR